MARVPGLHDRIHNYGRDRAYRCLLLLIFIKSEWNKIMHALESKSMGLILLVRGFLPLMLAAVIFFGSPCMPAHAQEEPDTVTMPSAKVFNSLISSNDTLFFITTDIAFTSTQDYDVDDAFTFTLLDSEDDIVGTTEGLATYNQGYGDQVISFYFDEGVITWEDTYTLRIMENPGVYETSNYWDFTIGASAFSDETDQSLALRAEVLESAVDLSSAFGVVLYETNESGVKVLSTYGELYYLLVIPGLQSMSSTLFGIETENPDYTKRTWSYELRDSLLTKYEDTFVEDFMTGYAGLFSMETSTAMNILSMLMFIVLMGLAVWKFKASIMAALMDGYAFLLLLMLIGFFDMIYAGFLAFASLVMGGVILFLNRS